MEKEVESLKIELERNKKEACQTEDQYKDALHHWQTKVKLMKIQLILSILVLKKIYIII